MICKSVKCTSYTVPFAEKVFDVLPARYRKAYSRCPSYGSLGLTEIRIRDGLPCSFTFGNVNAVMKGENGEAIVSDTDEIYEILHTVCGGSVYSCQGTIREGYIPFGGTRIGVSGSGIIVDGKYAGQHKITSLAIRIPFFAENAADGALGYIREKGFMSAMGILAVSPPNCGKTTFLRALAKGLSLPAEYGGFSKRVCIIDERGELYDKEHMRGCLCDVISGVPKIQALEMAIRTMSPEVVVLDEMGNENITGLLCKAYSGGVNVAASVHGNGVRDILYGRELRNAVSSGVFSTAYIMEENSAVKPGQIADLMKVVTE